MGSWSVKLRNVWSVVFLHLFSSKLILTLNYDLNNIKTIGHSCMHNKEHVYNSEEDSHILVVFQVLVKACQHHVPVYCRAFSLHPHTLKHVQVDTVTLYNYSAPILCHWTPQECSSYLVCMYQCTANLSSHTFKWPVNNSTHETFYSQSSHRLETFPWKRLFYYKLW